MAEITGEVKLDPSLVASLDESSPVLDEEEKDFLHKSISPDDELLMQRLVEVRKEAYERHPYPCIHHFHFVNLFMSVNPVYPEVLVAGKTGKTVFIDLGCCMGTDVRKLVADGYPAANVMGCDLRQEFIEFGYKLYQDQDQCGIHFFASNIFEVPYPADTNSEGSTASPGDISGVTHLKQLHGRVDHFYAGALFHLFDESTQYALALRVAQLVKHIPGTVIFGRHQGLAEEGYIEDEFERKRYGHSPKSWPVLWKKVFSEVESPGFAERVVVEARLADSFPPDAPNRLRGIPSMLYWSVKIV